MTTTETTAPRVLRRTKAGSVIAGVAAGLARYLGLDVTLVRIAFVVVPGFGLLFYLLA